MRLLLDTHVVLWWAQRSARLRTPARRAIAEADEVFVSAASAWEVSIKVALGRLVVPGPLSDVLASSGFLALPIDFRHAEAVETLPAVHADPFDRILVAQALVEDLHFMSGDRVLRRYPVSFVSA